MIANAAIAVGFLPWALILLRRAVAVSRHFWAPYPSPDVIYWELYSLVGGRLGAAALLVGAVVALRSNFSASVVLLFWAVAPVGLALIASLISTPIFLDRYFIGSLPALVTLAALGVAHLLSRQKWPTTIGAAVVLAAIIVGNLPYGTDDGDDWRAVGAYLQDHLQNSDCVLVYPAFNITPLRYYLRSEFCAILPTDNGEIDGQAIRAARTFVVFSNDKSSENRIRAANRIRATMNSFGREAEHFDALGIAIVEYQR